MIHIKQENQNLTVKIQCQIDQIPQIKSSEKIEQSFPSYYPQNQTLQLTIQSMITILNANLSKKDEDQYKKRYILGFISQEILQPPKKQKSKRIKNMTKKWSKKLIAILQQNKNLLSQNDLEKKHKVYQILKKPTPKLSEVSKLLSQNPWFVDFISQVCLKNHLLLKKVFLDPKIKPKTKIGMISSYPMLLNGFKNPQRFRSWNIEKFEKLADFTKISQSFQNYNFEQMLGMVQQEYQKLKQTFKKNICSQQNNITYHWICRIKLILNEQKLKSKYQYLQLYHLCLQKIKKSSINTLRSILSYEWLNRYIVEQKIKNLSLVREIISDGNIHILAKKNLLQTYPIFLDAVQNPKSLESWCRKLSKN